MKLGIIFLGASLTYDGEHYYCWASIFNMLRHFPKFFDIELICPVMAGESGGYKVCSSEMKIHRIPGWKNGTDLYYRKFLLIAKEILKIFLSRSKTWDAVLIIDSDPLSQVAFLVAAACRLPRLVYLRGDAIFEILNRNRQGIRYLLARLWCGWLKLAIPYMLKTSIGIVTGRALYEKYTKVNDNLIKMYASAVTDKDLFDRMLAKRGKYSDSLKLIMVGRLTSYKGIDVALRAVDVLIKKNLDVKLDVIGEGPAKDTLRCLAQKLGLGDIVNFSGFIPYGEELFKCYTEADIFLLPSRSEGTPKVIPEAFSFGLPVIASRVGGVPEMITDNYNGFLIQDDDYMKLASIIEKIVKTSGMLRKLSKGAFDSASNYTVDIQLRRLSEEIKRHYL